MFSFLFATLIALQLIPGAAGDDCPAACHCRHTSRYNESRRLVVCEVPDLSSVKLDVLATYTEPFILELHCDSGVPYDISHERFSSLTMMQELSMTNCKVTYIHRHAFSGLKHLTSIEIISASNYHLSVHDDAFAGIPQLESFKMTGCGLLELPVMCSFPNLRSFNVSNNSLANLKDAGLDCDLGSLVLIDVSNNRLASLAEIRQRVPRFPKLSVLMASNNMIHLSEHDTVLDQFPYLRIADLSHNNISELPDKLLRSNKVIEEIKLSHNHIHFIPSGFFSFSEYWLKIDLQNNTLDDSVWDRLTSMKNLLFLILRCNLLMNISDDSLQDMARLEHLDLSDNRIVSIAVKTFQNMQSLRYLSLAGNQIHTVDNDALYGLLSLSTLRLEGNRIYSINVDLLKDVQSLTQLNLSSNFLQDLPSLEKLTSLVTFDARNNRLQNLPEDLFVGQSKVKEINLSQNLIANLPEKLFEPCEALLKLDLSDNLIETVHPSVFMNLKIKQLFLQKNKIKEIGNAFKNIKELRELNLSDNQITDVITRYMIPSTLEMVDLSYNSIRHVRSKAFYGLSDVRMIDLRHNQITSLEESALSVSTSAYAQTGFLIDENPLVCDCDLLWLKKWDQSTRGPFIVNINNTRCSGALDYPPAPVMAIPEERFLCYYETRCPASCRCCGFSSGCDCKSTCPTECECYSSQDFYSVHYVRCNERNLTAVKSFLPRMATRMDLSGNDLVFIPSHGFIGLSNLTVLFLNNSNVQTIENRSFIGLTALKRLFLNNNKIKSLLVEMFTGLTAIQELFLEFNFITDIQTGVFDQMVSLKVLRLSNNYLQKMDDYSSHLVFTVPHLTMFSNPWLCDCILYFSAKENPAAYLNISGPSKMSTSLINCTVPDRFGRSSFVSLNYYGNICEGNRQKYIPEGLTRVGFNNTTVKVMFEEVREKTDDASVVKTPVNGMLNFKLVIPAMVGATLLILLLIAVVCRKDFVKCWLFTKYRCKSTDQELLYDKSRHYDAFVSYHQRDEALVLRELASRLEQAKPRYQLLVHHRDYPPRSSVTQFIESAVKSSHRTILVLSNDFVLENPWLKFVVNCVKQDAIRRLIIITTGKIDKSQLDPVIKSCLQTDRHLVYRGSWFWEKLYYLLPEPGKVERSVARAEAHPYACTDLTRLSTAVRDNQAYEEPTTTLKTMTSMSDRPLPSVTDYIPGSSQSYSYGGSQQSSNIYEEIADREPAYTEPADSRYDEPWKDIRLPADLDTPLPEPVRV